MALNTQPSQEEKDLLEKIRINKESLRHGRDIVISIVAFGILAETYVEHMDDLNIVEKLMPISSLVALIGSLVPITKNLWDLETAKKELKKITDPKADNSSQALEKTVKTNYEHRNPSSPIPE